MIFIFPIFYGKKMEKFIFEKFFACKGISRNDKLKTMGYFYLATKQYLDILKMALEVATTEAEITLAFKGFFSSQGFLLSAYEKVEIPREDTEMTTICIAEHVIDSRTPEPPLDFDDAL